MSAALDRPCWSALTGPQAALARHHGRALRIDPGYGPFAAAEPGHEADLVGLLRDTADEIWLIEPHAVAAPPGTRVRRIAQLMQMVAESEVDAPDDARITELGAADAAAMTRLALATKPGPWGPLTRHYDPFHGVHRGGALVAMAGERMRPADTMIEVSGVCTDPAHRGQGLAARLIRRVMAGHRARGAASFLHSYADNAGAIALYRSLGFAPRAELVVTVIGKE